MAVCPALWRRNCTRPFDAVMNSTRPVFSAGFSRLSRLLLDEIERVRREGVDREIFTLCKNEKYGQLIENLENVEDSASQMADFALAGQTVAQQITMLAGLTAEDADAALQHILRPERMAMMRIEPDGTVGDEDEEETEE